MTGHIVWDWNGTVFGDSRALIDATIDAFATCGLPGVTRAAYQRRHTQPITTFYERLAGRPLTDDEQRQLDECFRAAYARHRAAVTLTADAINAFSRWTAAGGRQSLLSMYPHEQLVPLITEAGIGHHFTRVDGSTGRDLAHKAPHLRRHLHEQGIAPHRAIVVGDSLDDARAARECGVRCVLYHPGEDALHVREHVAEAGVPVVSTLTAAVELLLNRPGPSS
ncbi:HAD family hydrolase [Actinoplanes auranticolor]|uniref:Phosphatase n=1 Tax=Actinoplanes auranticolor TaxID=47988 RepID=A0A919SCY3_9ACTN|nr:HAD family hydrolase [Actinoplanes auranticolor]GIM69319.1 phosphatase [Actinoplanes auranticolor]